MGAATGGCDKNGQNIFETIDPSIYVSGLTRSARFSFSPSQTVNPHIRVGCDCILQFTKDMRLVFQSTHPCRM